MGSGRWLNLLLEAQLRGHLDFSEARPLDRDWQLKARWTLDWIEQQLLVAALDRKRQVSLAAVACPGTPAETIRRHWDIALETQAAALRSQLPWLAPEPTTAVVTTGLTQTWRRLYGDERDPAVRKKIADTAAAIRARAKPHG